MKLIITILTFLVLGCSSKMQNKDFKKYDTHVWSAMIQYKEKDYQKSLDNFKKAFKIIPDENVSDYFYAAAAALHLEKYDTAKELIIQSIVETKTSKDYFLSFEEFDPFRSNELFSDVENKYDKFIAEFYEQLEHPDIYREIDSLVEVDQKNRKQPIDWEVTNKNDSLNIKRLIEITKEYGWQKKGWIILWHQRGTYGESNYVWDFFKPYIDQQIKNGKMRKTIWARYEDDKSTTQNQRQIFGFYWFQFDQYPVINVDNLDKRRTEYDLPPFWYLNKVYDIPLPKGYDFEENYHQHRL